MTDVSDHTDWMDDDDLSFDDAMAHFESLDPQPTGAPHVPGGVFVMAAPTYGSVTIDATPELTHDGVAKVLQPLAG